MSTTERIRNQAGQSNVYVPHPWLSCWHDPMPQERRPRRQFTLLPVLLSRLLITLQKRGLVTKELPCQNLDYHPWYNPLKSCEYHMGEVGHLTDACLPLKHKVQNLLDRGALTLQSLSPSEQLYHSPDYGGNVNVHVEHAQRLSMKSLM